MLPEDEGGAMHNKVSGYGMVMAMSASRTAPLFRWTIAVEVVVVSFDG